MAGLPERPDLEKLKKDAKRLVRLWTAADTDARRRVRAHYPKAENAGRLPLGGAQLVLAREHGFATWAELRAAVEARAARSASAVDRFLRLACSRNAAEAVELLDRHPELTRSSAHAAAAAGDARALAATLQVAPDALHERAGPNRAPPLAYAARSRLHAVDAARATGLLASAELLLAAGADPNAAWLDPNHPNTPLPILYGAVREAQHLAMAQRLLAAGAEPNDGESLYHAAEVEPPLGHAMLRLLLDHGAEPAGTNALKRKLDMEDPPGARILLEAGADPNEVGHNGETPLHHALRRGREAAVISLLLTHDADPALTRARDGLDARGVARLYGRPDPLGRDDAPDVDPAADLVGACAAGDGARARQIAAADPQILDRVRARYGAAIVELAGEGNTDALRELTAMGIPVDIRGENGEIPLQQAAFSGRADTVAWLLSAGADPAYQDPTYDGDALGWTMEGSLYAEPADVPAFVRVVEELVAHDAPPHDATWGNEGVRTAVTHAFARRDAAGAS